MYRVEHFIVQDSEDTIIISTGDYDDEGWQGHSVLEGGFTGDPGENEALFKILKGVLEGDWDWRPPKGTW